MGCSSSKETDESVESPRMLGPISRPINPINSVPAPRRDYNTGLQIQHDVFDLTRTDIVRALEFMAEYIQERRGDVILIAVGGAVNTVFLRTRETTHDVDFFVNQLSREQAILINAASRYAESRSDVRLGSEWINNATMNMIPAQTRARLYEVSVEQRDIVFQRPGLTVLAAPWSYAFISKVGRMTLGPPRRREYDLSDAVSYLHEFITKRNEGRPVEWDNVQEWSRSFQRNAPVEMLREVEELYYHTYRKHGLVLR